jgi:hypothetical protein
VSGGPRDLCSDAEVFLHDDIKEGRVILVNDIFLMKKTGGRVGVAVEEKSVEGGEIKPGIWYRNADAGLGWEIRQAVQNGETSINLPGKTTWMEGRDVKSNEWKGTRRDDLLEQAKEAAEAIRNKPPKAS